MELVNILSISDYKIKSLFSRYLKQNLDNEKDNLSDEEIESLFEHKKELKNLSMSPKNKFYPGYLINSSIINKLKHIYQLESLIAIIGNNSLFQGINYFNFDDNYDTIIKYINENRIEYINTIQNIEKQGGIIDLPLRQNAADRPRQMVDFDKGKQAITIYEVLRYTPEGKTWVLFTPATGRTHQLRVHASHTQGLGIPIVGDMLYGTAAERLMLHATSISFVHPVTGKNLTFTSPFPQIM